MSFLEIDTESACIQLDGDHLIAEAGNSYDAYPANLETCTPQQIAQLVHKLSALAWISVDDELPETPGWYQVKGSPDVIEYFTKFQFSKGVTHWQPLAMAN